MTRQIKINIENAEFQELEKVKKKLGLSWERLIKDSILKKENKK